jgi:hypothetical protein
MEEVLEDQLKTHLVLCRKSEQTANEAAQRVEESRKEVARHTKELAVNEEKLSKSKEEMNLKREEAVRYFIEVMPQLLSSLRVQKDIPVIEKKDRGANETTRQRDARVKQKNDMIKQKKYSIATFLYAVIRETSGSKHSTTWNTLYRNFVETVVQMFMNISSTQQVAVEGNGGKMAVLELCLLLDESTFYKERKEMIWVLLFSLEHPLLIDQSDCEAEYVKDRARMKPKFDLTDRKHTDLEYYFMNYLIQVYKVNYTDIPVDLRHAIYPNFRKYVIFETNNQQPKGGVGGDELKNENETVSGKGLETDVVAKHMADRGLYSVICDMDHNQKLLEKQITEGCADNNNNTKLLTSPIAEHSIICDGELGMEAKQVVRRTTTALTNKGTESIKTPPQQQSIKRKTNTTRAQAKKARRQIKIQQSNTKRTKTDDDVIVIYELTSDALALKSEAVIKFSSYLLQHFSSHKYDCWITSDRDRLHKTISLRRFYWKIPADQVEGMRDVAVIHILPRIISHVNMLEKKGKGRFICNAFEKEITEYPNPTKSGRYMFYLDIKWIRNNIPLFGDILHAIGAMFKLQNHDVKIGGFCVLKSYPGCGAQKFHLDYLNVPDKMYFGYDATMSFSLLFSLQDETKIDLSSDGATCTETVQLSAGDLFIMNANLCHRGCDYQQTNYRLFFVAESPAMPFEANKVDKIVIAK